MKKVFLSLAFVLAIGTSLMNANTSKVSINSLDPTYESCAGASLETYEFLEAFTGDWRYAFKISEEQLTDCLNEVDEINGV
jgi:hypothetical protein